MTHKPTQANMFSENHADLPLFSNTPIRSNVNDFKPAARQPQPLIPGMQAAYTDYKLPSKPNPIIHRPNRIPGQTRTLRVCKHPGSPDPDLIVFRHHYKPRVYHHPSSYSIARIERLAKSITIDAPYTNQAGKETIATWYTYDPHEE
jgi:hypothetical protein